MSSNKLGARMKEYENKTKLTKRSPVIIRIDGTHFHTYTKKMKKPFDETLAKAFWETAKYLAQNIMGCKMVYHQSDEISLLLTNYDKVTTQSWFGNDLQKMVSVSASMATAKFNEIMFPITGTLAFFDSRAFVLPKEEVTNYFLWRQQDATKNSIAMVAQANFKHKELQGYNGSQLQEKLFTEKNINWNNLPIWQKRGVCITKQSYLKGTATRTKWDVDFNTPQFSKDRDYIDQHVFSEFEMISRKVELNLPKEQIQSLLSEYYDSKILIPSCRNISEKERIENSHYHELWSITETIFDAFKEHSIQTLSDFAVVLRYVFIQTFGDTVEINLDVYMDVSKNLIKKSKHYDSIVA
ncbi:tRNAHis guanylyltransferase [Bacillus cereus]|nr:tRNA(His) guanylyltransferase Thg1 family protein [Bacillus cereus]PES55554.1 hypothetical protein CN515_05785 [Bacillus cereus]SME50545.1 tRNAHis guanylyltransferase [Bacillus cereus]